MNVNVIVGKEVPALVTAPGLADMSCGANVMDWYAVRGDDT